MPFNKALDDRVLECITPWETVRKKMFGGTCYLLNGNMICGVYKDFLILRLGTEGADEALRRPSVKPFDITGKPMKGWIMVAQEELEGEKLKKWLEKALSFGVTLPPK